MSGGVTYLPEKISQIWLHDKRHCPYRQIWKMIFGWGPSHVMTRSRIHVMTKPSTASVPSDKS